VKEKQRAPVPHISLGPACAPCPRAPEFLTAAGLCRRGGLAHTHCSCCWPRRKLALHSAWRASRRQPPQVLHPAQRPFRRRLDGRRAAGRPCNKGLLLPPRTSLPCSWRWPDLSAINPWTLAAFFSLAGRLGHGGNAGRCFFAPNRWRGGVTASLWTAGHCERLGRFRFQPDRWTTLDNSRHVIAFALQWIPFLSGRCWYFRSAREAPNRSGQPDASLARMRLLPAICSTNERRKCRK